MRGKKALERFQEQTERVCRFEFANAQQEDYVLSTCRETLADGGVGSSKTFGGIMRLLILAERYPRSRWFVARQTYKDLTQTTRKTFERICPPGWIKRDKCTTCWIQESEDGTSPTGPQSAPATAGPLPIPTGRTGCILGFIPTATLRLTANISSCPRTSTGKS